MGGKLRAYVREMSDGMYVPRYLRTEFVHLKWKFDCMVSMVWGGIATPMASDLEKFIFRFKRAPYVSNSFRRFGREIVGFVKEKKKPST